MFGHISNRSFYCTIRGFVQRRQGSYFCFCKSWRVYAQQFLIIIGSILSLKCADFVRTTCKTLCVHGGSRRVFWGRGMANYREYASSRRGTIIITLITIVKG